MGLQIGVDDEVILPTYVCRDVADAIRGTGAQPIFCDVGRSWVVEPTNVEPLVNARTKALILPHVYGMIVDIPAFRRFGVPIIEDCAQAFGGPGQFNVEGDIAAFSFHPTKCLTTGEGGMAASRNPALVDKMRRLRSGTAEGKDRTVFSPLSDIAATLGLSQLSRYETMLARRALQAAAYAEALKGSTAQFDWYGRRRGMYFRFPVRWTRGFESARDLIAKHGVTVRRGVDELIHRQEGSPDSLFPNASELFSETVSLPIYPALSDLELGTCVSACRNVFAEGH
jgi:UDP-4-amino-4-deoxy-L-arabinose-oxoglutarate aminotransferase